MADIPQNLAKSVWIPLDIHDRLANISQVTGRNIKKTVEIALSLGIEVIEKEIDKGDNPLVSPNKRKNRE